MPRSSSGSRRRSRRRCERGSRRSPASPSRASPSSRPRRKRARPLTPATAPAARAPVEPIAAVDDLIELAAALLEGQGSGDDAERFLDGVSRLCAFRGDGFERRTGALAKRAREAAGGDVTGTSGAEVVARVVLAWTAGERPPSRTPLTLLGFLGLRAAEVANRARIGKARGLLALPTHAGGWIDPAVLAARLADRGRFLNRPDPLDREAASVRASGFAPIRLEPSLTMQKGWWYSSPEPTVSLRVAELPPEADHFRARLASDDPQWSWDPWSASDALGVRWLLTVLPGDPEPAYGHALPPRRRAARGAGGVRPSRARCSSTPSTRKCRSRSWAGRPWPQAFSVGPRR